MNTGPRQLDFEIDKLTNSVENVRTGEVFETEITRLTTTNVSLLSDSVWQFDWLLEMKSADREIHGLATIENPLILQGLISISDNLDHIFMHLLENSAFNKGNKKVYAGVAGNLVAFACQRAFDRGYDGAVAFVAKTNLIEHYITTLGAKRFSGNRMFIEGLEAQKLVARYFSDEK